jgi:hypothetical protein
MEEELKNRVPVNKNILVVGYEHFISSDLVSLLQAKNNKVTYSLEDTQIDYSKLLVGSYITIYNSKEFISDIKKSDIIYFLQFANRNKKIEQKEIETFKKIVTLVKNTDKDIKIVLLSSIDVYGTKRKDETCFVDSPLSPNNYNGVMLAFVEEFLFNTIENYSIIRSSEIMTREIIKEFYPLFSDLFKQKIFLIPKASNHINMSSKSTILSALLIAGAEENKEFIINITETPSLTFTEFFEKLYFYAKRDLKIEIPKRYINLFSWKTKFHNIPKFLFNDQKISTIEANTADVIFSWSSDLFIQKLLENYNKAVSLENKSI